jgi:hypothetical protein
MMLGWSDPRFTKQWVIPASHIASKKANDAVYILGEVLEKALRVECCSCGWRR